MTENKRWRIIGEEFISYSGGSAYLISNGDCKFNVWERKEDAQKVCNKLNELSEEKEICENEIARLEMIISKLKNNDFENYTKKIQELEDEHLAWKRVD